MKTIVALFCLVAGCGNPKILHQEQAEHIVWYGVYNMTQAPPSVDWVVPPALTCHNGEGFFVRTSPWTATTSGTCVAGEHWDGIGAVVALPTGATFSDTAYAHELLHAASYIRTGVGDVNHSGPGFQPGGALDIALLALMNNGL